MTEEIKFSSETEFNKFRTRLSEMIIDGTYEVVASHNIETKNWNFLINSIYRNTTTKEYFQLSAQKNFNSFGAWKKVREIIRDQPLLVRSEYCFKTMAGGNFGLVGIVELQIEQLSEEDELDVEIIFSEDIRSRYIKTSLEFGLIYGFETLQPHSKIKGKYTVKVLAAGFHEIDSSTVTMAYAANMALRRALDVEKTNTLVVDGLKFVFHKSYPIHKSIR